MARIARVVMRGAAPHVTHISSPNLMLAGFEDMRAAGCRQRGRAGVLHLRSAPSRRWVRGRHNRNPHNKALPRSPARRIIR
jgi:hypothetical protein